MPDSRPQPAAPAHDGFLIHPHAPAFFLRHYGLAALVALLLLPGGFLVLEQTRVMEFALGVWAIAAIILSVALIHTRLYMRAFLTISGEELVHEWGILGHHRMVAPINKITDIGMDASWSDRLMGVCTLKVNTAGGSGYEIMAQDFPRAGVDRLHAELMRLIKRTPGSLPDELAKK